MKHTSCPNSLIIATSQGENRRTAHLFVVENLKLQSTVFLEFFFRPIRGHDNFCHILENLVSDFLDNVELCTTYKRASRRKLLHITVPITPGELG